MSDWIEEGMVAEAGGILAAGPICDECLGRAFAKAGRGLPNGERGRTLRDLAAGEAADPASCWVCGGLFDRADEFAARASDSAAAIEFDTYLFGVRPSVRLVEMERLFLQRFPTGRAESLKHAFNRVVGKAFERRVGRATVAFTDPDVSFLIDLASETIDLHIASLYAYGRYRKLARGIPQTRWPCRACRGRGCEACGFTGKQYPESVEEWIAEPFVEAAEASGAHLHGAGREDIDARMLGSGRPFVLEIVSPAVRSLDLAALSSEVNRRAAGRVEVTPLRPVGRAEVARIKETRAAKRYRAVVALDEPAKPTALAEALESLVGTIEQRTPQRVSHRRADRVRCRRLNAALGELIDERTASVEFDAEGGLYIKELVSGDHGRTEPSLAGRLGFGCTVSELDVVEVRSDAFLDADDALDAGGALS